MADAIPVPDWPVSLQDLDPLVEQLGALDGPVDEAGAWSEPLWQAIVQHQANRWALPPGQGGPGLDRLTLLARYGRVAEGSLTAAFILTQHDAAVRRLAPAADRPRIAHWLGEVAAARAFTTVGLSQLTTSKRHGDTALIAEPVGPGNAHELVGVVPWVTGAERAQVLVLGAVRPDGQQILAAVPADRPGLSVEPRFRLAALQASCTAEVGCDRVRVEPEDRIVGPVPDAMALPGVAGTGGLETSALALGQSRAALLALSRATAGRDDVHEPVETLAALWQGLATDLASAATAAAGAPPASEIRRRANALVLRITQAHLVARRGSGFLQEDPAQRWARQALFFLVWSCPSPVARASIRDLAGLCDR